VCSVARRQTAADSEETQIPTNARRLHTLGHHFKTLQPTGNGNTYHPLKGPHPLVQLEAPSGGRVMYTYLGSFTDMLPLTPRLNQHTSLIFHHSDRSQVSNKVFLDLQVVRVDIDILGRCLSVTASWLTTLSSLPFLSLCNIHSCRPPRDRSLN
jgi:hypothetical protein